MYFSFFAVVNRKRERKISTRGCCEMSQVNFGSATFNRNGLRVTTVNVLQRGGWVPFLAASPNDVLVT